MEQITRKFFRRRVFLVQIFVYLLSRLSNLVGLTVKLAYLDNIPVAGSEQFLLAEGKCG